MAKQTRHVTLYVHCPSCSPLLAFLFSPMNRQGLRYKLHHFPQIGNHLALIRVTTIFRRKTFDGLHFATQLTVTIWFGRLTGWSYSGHRRRCEKDLGNVRRFPLQTLGNSRDEGTSLLSLSLFSRSGYFLGYWYPNTHTHARTHAHTRARARTHTHAIKPARTRMETFVIWSQEIVKVKAILDNVPTRTTYTLNQTISGS